jgi:hypothetical protein
LDEVLDQLVQDDLTAKVSAIKVATSNNQGSPSPHIEEADRSWLTIWSDCEATEQRLIESWSRLQDSDEPRDRLDAREVLVYVAVLHTIRQAFAAGGPLSRLVDEEDFDHPIIYKGFELIARARSKLSVNPQESWLVLEGARSVLGLKPMNS